MPENRTIRSDAFAHASQFRGHRGSFLCRLWKFTSDNCRKFRSRIQRMMNEIDDLQAVLTGPVRSTEVAGQTAQTYQDQTSGPREGVAPDRVIRAIF